MKPLLSGRHLDPESMPPFQPANEAELGAGTQAHEHLVKAMESMEAAIEVAESKQNTQQWQDLIRYTRRIAEAIARED